MKEYDNLIMGLISGLALMILDNKIARTSVTLVITLFNPANTNRLLGLLHTWSLRLITLLSFIGVIIIIICSLMIIFRIYTKLIKSDHD